MDDHASFRWIRSTWSSCSIPYDRPPPWSRDHLKPSSIVLSHTLQHIHTTAHHIYIPAFYYWLELFWHDMTSFLLPLHSRHLEHRLHLCWNARRKTPLPWKGPWVGMSWDSWEKCTLSLWYILADVLIIDAALPLWHWSDVNQFSIITELLGTPPEDVIQTICSENVSQSLFKRDCTILCLGK